MNNLIAISGLKNSGKDTAAKMLQFCLNTPKCLHHYWIYEHFGGFALEGPYQIHRFADPLKEVLSVILSVPVEKFEDRKFKELYYVDFSTLTIYHKQQVEETKILPDNKFSKLAKTLNPKLIEDYYLSVRQVLQYVGTEVLRSFLGDTLWINATFAKEDKYKIISDLRFKTEYFSVKEHGGIVIMIVRNNCVAGTHASEREVSEMLDEHKYDFKIDNNSDLQTLFNNIKNITYACRN